MREINILVFILNSFLMSLSPWSISIGNVESIFIRQGAALWNPKPQKEKTKFWAIANKLTPSSLCPKCPTFVQVLSCFCPIDVTGMRHGGWKESRKKAT